MSLDLLVAEKFLQMLRVILGENGLAVIGIAFVLVALRCEKSIMTAFQNSKTHFDEILKGLVQ